jgi:hypothetical protein
MISAASVLALLRWPWIPLSSLSGFDASTNYRFQFFVIPKSKWSVLGGSSTPKKKAGLLYLQFFCLDAIAASDRSWSKGSPLVSAQPTCLSLFALILLRPFLWMTCAPMHGANASYFHRWWTSAAPSGIRSLSFNTMHQVLYALNRS